MYTTTEMHLNPYKSILNISGIIPRAKSSQA